MTPTIVTLVAVVVAVGIAALILVGRRAKARNEPSDQARPINPECAAGGHAYQPFGTGYRCATCGNHVSSEEGEIYGRVEDGREDRRREPR